MIDSSQNATVAPPDILRAALDGLPIGVLMVTRDGAIVYANREIGRVFGYTPGDLIGRSIDIILSDGLELDPDEVARASGEMLGRRLDGSEIPIDVGFTRIAIADTTYVLTSVVDLSESRRLHSELQISHDELMQAEALVGDLGAEFISVRSVEADRAIEQALGRLVRAHDLDRSVIFYLADEGDFISTHQWTRPGLLSPPPRISAREHLPWHLAHIRGGELVRFSAIDEVPEAIDRETLRRFGTKSSVTVPLVTDGRTWGAVSFVAARAPRAWSPAVINRFQVVAQLFANVIARKQTDEAFRREAVESTSLRERLRDENAYLRRELKGFTGESAIVGHSPAIRRVIEQVRQVAATESTVLLMGEIGTGKARIAAWIHELSARSARAMVRVNCSALSPASIESELFGIEKGSYVETDFRRTGRLELAQLSTLLLDEVGDLPIEVQASLARVLHDRHLEPLSGARHVKLDLRVIATTRKDLKRCIEEGTFRDDLYDQLNVFPLHIPPLRERPDDIPLLVWRFVDEFSEAFGKPIDAIDKESMKALQQYAWPGNARELRNVVERAMIVGSGRHLHIDLPGRGPIRPLLTNIDKPGLPRSRKPRRRIQR